MARHARRNGASRVSLEQLEAREVPAIIQTGLPTWLSAGPAPQVNAQITLGGPLGNQASGAVEELTFHPTDPNILFAAGVNGGIWRTFNAQDVSPTYVPLTDNLPSLSIGSMSLNSENPNQIVAGVATRSAGGRITDTGVLSFGGDLIGVIMSDNALAPNPTFRVVGGATLQGQEILAITARNGYILAGGDGGLFRSVDNGASFQELTGTGGLPPITDGPGGSTTYYFIEPDPANSNRVYAIGNGGMFRSDNIRDAFPTWTDITDPGMLLDSFTANAKIAIHNSPGNNVVYVATNFAQPDAVLYTTDFGTTWTVMDLPTRPTPPRNIEDATNATPIQITVPFHGFPTGIQVRVTGVQGNLAANALWTITVTGQDTFTLDGSVGTGDYTGGGQVVAFYGPNEGGQGALHMSLAADPVDPNIVYLGGDRTPFATGSSFRGNRGVASGAGLILPSPQWEPLVDVNSSGTSHYADSRVMTFDALGNLWQGDDGGIYRRANPRQNGPVWTSALGNLDLGQFYSLNYDRNNNVLFGGTQDSGSIFQVNGEGPVGSKSWVNVRFGDGGASAVDNTSKAGFTYRYVTGNALTTALRFAINSDNKTVSTTPVLFAAPGSNEQLSGLDDADKGLTIFTAKFVLNSIDPRLGMLGNAKLYEDDNPAGLALDNISKVTPDGLAGDVTSIVYGGRLNGVGITRVAYVGTQAGQVFLRSTFGGFTQLTVPGEGGIDSIVTDPDDFRRVYVLRNLNTILFSADAGRTWENITTNLVAPGLDLTGTPAGGLTTQLLDLAIYDPVPGDNGGGTVLIAAGRGGVYRYVPGLVSPTEPWSEYGIGLPNSVANTVQVEGTRLFVGTQGRGAWVIPDIADSITQVATITVLGDGSDNVLRLDADPNNPASLIVSDGLGNTLSVERSNAPRIVFRGGAGADTIIISASGEPGGDLSSLKSAVFIDAGGDVGDRLIIRDAGRLTPTQVTITANQVGGGFGDNFFGLGGSIQYTGLANGTLEVDLGTEAVDGSVVTIQSTSAGTTLALGTTGLDTFLVSGADGTLNGIVGTVEVQGRGGEDILTVSDVGATQGNANVVIAGDAITGLAGAADQATVRFGSIARLDIDGSDSPTLSESFTILSPSVPLTLRANDGPDRVNVRGVGATPVTVDAGAGNDLIRVGSRAGDPEEGDLSGILGALVIDAGSGDNQLLVSAFGSPVGVAFTITPTLIGGPTPIPITYQSTGGRFATADGSGVLVRGSNVGADTFTVLGTLAGSQFAADGAGGDDVFNVAASDLAGEVRLRGGAGADSFFITPNSDRTFGITADFLGVSGGGGNDQATLFGFLGDDPNPVTATLTSTIGGQVSGVGNPMIFDTLAELVYDGRTGRNNFTLANGLNQSLGSAQNFAAGVVYRSGSATSGTFSFAGGTIGPAVTVRNINGSDAVGLVYNGDPTGSGQFRDTLTVLGVSDTGRGQSGPLAELTADSGADTVIISDAFVYIGNATLGDLRTVAIARVNGRPTISTLYVRTGDEATRGDTVTVTPSRDVNIIVDGQGPSTAQNGDQLRVATTESVSAVQSTDPALGPVPTRLTTPSGASVAVTGFENVQGNRPIYAVGADAGGGPRVRVVDAITGQVLFDQFVFEEEFTGGVRVATGDVTGDGVPDLIVAAGYGGGPRIRVFDGGSFTVIADFFAYESFFRGGVFVAVGDLLGTGRAQIITGAGAGGGPLVRTFDATGQNLTSFFAYDERFRGGVRVAAGDVNGDGFADVITGAGAGGGPHVRVFSGITPNVLTEFMAYDLNYREGIYVGAGDIDGDGFADIIIGPGGNSIPEIRFRSSRDGGALVRVNVVTAAGDTEIQRPISPTLAALNPELGGIRVATTADTNGLNQRILATRGPGFLPRVRRFSIDPPLLAGEDLVFEREFLGGLFIG